MLVEVATPRHQIVDLIGREPSRGRCVHCRS